MVHPHVHRRRLPRSGPSVLRSGVGAVGGSHPSEIARPLQTYECCPKAERRREPVDSGTRSPPSGHVTELADCARIPAPLGPGGWRQLPGTRLHLGDRVPASGSAPRQLLQHGQHPPEQLCSAPRFLRAQVPPRHRDLQCRQRLTRAPRGRKEPRPLIPGLRRIPPGGPGGSRLRGSHRSGRADFPHPAPQVAGSLGLTLRGG
jgi:hypothetical protein